MVWGVVVVLAVALPALSQKQMAKSPKLQAAKTIYFEDHTGADAVAAATIAQLKKWGRFQVVKDKKDADVIFVLTADPYHGGEVLLASGQTGTVNDKGNVQEDRIPNYNVQALTRDAYLSVIDAKSGDRLWSESHVWGGVLTAVNSAGARLVKKLEKEMGK